MSTGVATPSITDQWSDGKRLHVIGTLTFTSDYAAGGLVADFGAVGVRSSRSPLMLNIPPYLGATFQFTPDATDPLITNGKVKIFGGGDFTAATGTLTSDNTNVANGATVTIGGQTYTFKTALTATTTANEVLIGANADASLLNLIRAINGTGTAGTDYGSLTEVNPYVSAASSVTSHAFEVTAKVAGVAGNAIATTETSSHLSWGAATLSGGTDESIEHTELSAGALSSGYTGNNFPFYGIWDQFV